MGLRDLLLFGVLALLVVKVPTKPYIGALAWVVFGVMVPHRLAYGPANDFQFAQVIAILTVIGLFLTKDHRQLKGGAPAVVLAVLLAWMCLTTVFSMNTTASLDYLIRVVKTFAMTWVLLTVLHTRRHVDLLIWALVLSLGFYGIKGGLFTITTLGQFRVNGPEGSVIEGNNSLAVGLVTVIPLMFYLHQEAREKWLRLALKGAMGLTSISVLGSYSRGALLAIFAMGCLLWLRGRQKVTLFVVGLLFVLVAIPFMPAQWLDRMNTIQTYEEDASSAYRLIAWETAYNIAKGRFPVGGGFEWQGAEATAQYSPDPNLVMVPHSIYFEVLGTQGFIGLGLYLLFWCLVWWQCGWLRKNCRGEAELQWAHTLGSMVQVGIVGYAVGGAFLNIAFWEFPYYLFAAVAVARYAVMQQLTAPQPSERTAAVAATRPANEKPISPA